MEILIVVLYTLGVILCFLYLERSFEEYKNKHPEEEIDEKYNGSLIISMSLFSWLGLFALIAGEFCHYNDRD